MKVFTCIAAYILGGNAKIVIQQDKFQSNMKIYIEKLAEKDCETSLMQECALESYDEESTFANWQIQLEACSQATACPINFDDLSAGK